MKIKKNLHWLVCILFFCCAKQSAPTGGPKDTIPPVLVRAIPPNETIRFNGRKIEMEFSEMVNLANPKEQLIVTPSISKDYEIKARKNSVVIELPNNLEDSTTYTFNFRDAIQDVTERNPVRNFQYALSTGSYLDSLSVEGSVYHIIQGEEKADVTVFINPKNDTFNIFKHTSAYFTKTNKKGVFKIDHLKPGVYFVHAIADKNKNLIADSRNEAYGFLSDSLYLRNDTSKISIGILNLDARPLKLTSARPYNTYFNIRFTKNLKDFKLSTEDSTHLDYSFADDQANIKLYNTLPKADSIAIRLTARDSIENWVDTTVYAKFPEREATPEKFDMSIIQSKVLADKGQFYTALAFTKPVHTINFDSLYYEIDSVKRIYFTREDIYWDQLYNVLTIRKKVDKILFVVEKKEGAVATLLTPEKKEGAAPTVKPEKKEGAAPTPKPAKLNDPQSKVPKIRNQLYAGRATFISVENDSSRKVIHKITPLKTEDLSEIIFDIKSNHKNILVQLLGNTTKEVLQEKAYTLKGKFEDLESGDYIVRVIIDSNQNGVWDPGNYLQNQEPEKMIYYKDEKNSTRITLKTNWELELAPMLITY